MQVCFIIPVSSCELIVCLPPVTLGFALNQLSVNLKSNLSHSRDSGNWKVPTIILRLFPHRTHVSAAQTDWHYAAEVYFTVHRGLRVFCKGEEVRGGFQSCISQSRNLDKHPENGGAQGESQPCLLGWMLFSMFIVAEAHITVESGIHYWWSDPFQLGSQIKGGFYRINIFRGCCAR